MAVCEIPGMVPLTVIVYWPATEEEPPDEAVLPALECIPQPIGSRSIARTQKASRGQRRRRRARKPMGSSMARAVPAVFQKEGTACAVWPTEKVSAACWLELPLSVTDVGDMEQVAVAGTTEQVRATGPVDPFTESISTGNGDGVWLPVTT